MGPYYFRLGFGYYTSLQRGPFISRETNSILYRETQRWVLQGATSQSLETDMPLNVIRAALQERKSSTPHDRAFALFDVLRSWGVSRSEANYEQSIH